MSPRAAEVDTAFKWGIPLNLWDGTGQIPTEAQKAEMLAYVEASAKMRSIEDRASQPKEKGKIGVNIGG